MGSTCWLINSKKAARTFDKIGYGGNQSGRSREQKIVRVRTLFERFLYKWLNYSRTKNRVRGRGRALYERTLNVMLVSKVTEGY